MKHPEIISIQGPSGVGKTSVLERLRKNLDTQLVPEHIDYITRYSLELPSPPHDKESFLKNQLFFLELEKKRWRMAKLYQEEGKDVILDRDPLDTVIFTFSYPYVFEPTWHIMEEIKESVVEDYEKGVLGLADRLIFLSCPWEILVKRVKRDTQRPRGHYRTVWFFDMFVEMVFRDLPSPLNNRVIFIDGSQRSEILENALAGAIRSPFREEEIGSKDSEIVNSLINQLLQKGYSLEKLFSLIGYIDIHQELVRKWQK